MNIRFLIIFVLVSTIPISANAGDYELYISENTNRVCNGRKIFTQNGGCYKDAWRPICRADEVIQDLKGYFSGSEPQIKILVPAFGNGHVTFCDENLRLKISRTLREIKASGLNKRGRRLEDFITVNKL